MPESLIAFLESTDYESAVRNAVSLGADADTMACIAGGVAQAFYGAVPKQIADEARKRLPDDLLSVLERFERRYGTTGRDPTRGGIAPGAGAGGTNRECPISPCITRSDEPRPGARSGVGFGHRRLDFLSFALFSMLNSVVLWVSD